MTRFFVRSVLLAITVFAVPMQEASAQEAATPRTRVLVAPQVGAVVGTSKGAEVNAIASVVAEVPIGSGVAFAAEWVRPYGGTAVRTCRFEADDECVIGAEVRSAGTIGLTLRPVRLGPLEPYAGVSAGVARWVRNEEWGVGPSAAVRAGLDVRVIGPVGVRADVVRRLAWANMRYGVPLRTDVLSLGARIAFRR
jgi:hypothetical protein